MPAAPVIDTDLLIAFPEFVEWMTMVADEDWTRVLATLDALPDARSRIVAMREMSTVGQSEDLFAAAEPSGAGTVPRVLLAARHIEIGWTARSNLRAQHVSPEQFATFFRHLRVAEQLLIGVVAEEPDNVPAWYFRLLTARGLELGRSEARRRYDRLAHHDPHCYLAQSQLLQTLCPKWGGDWDAAAAFVAECVAVAPPGAPSHALVAELHLERWLDVDRDPTARDHLRQESVRAELVAAANRSTWHPDFRRDYLFYRAHGCFAVTLALGRHHRDAAPHLKAVDGHLDRYPWKTFDDPRALYLALYEASVGKA